MQIKMQSIIAPDPYTSGKKPHTWCILQKKKKLDGVKLEQNVFWKLNSFLKIYHETLKRQWDMIIWLKAVI